MATMNVAEVGIGSAAVTGAIWVAPKDTTLPTDATTALGGSFVLLGFTSDAGVTISESTSKTDFRAWEGRQLVRTVTTEYTESVSFMPIQCNSDVAKLMWGNGKVTVGTGGALHIQHHGESIDPVVVVIETTPRTGYVNRYTGTFQLVERGEQTMDGASVDGRQLTFNAIPDSNGITMHEYVAAVSGTTS